MSSLMVSNLRKIHELNSRWSLVDIHMYRNHIGSLMYLIHLRPYICYAMCILSQFMSEPKQRNWVVAKHVLIHL